MCGIMDHVLGHTHEPLEKVFFQVIIDFNRELGVSEKPEPEIMIAAIPEDDSSFESDALSTYPQAEEVVEQMLDNICGKFPGSMVTELTLDQQSDEYHLCIRDGSGGEIAKVGIIAIDYSDVMIH